MQSIVKLPASFSYPIFLASWDYSKGSPRVEDYDEWIIKNFAKGVRNASIRCIVPYFREKNTTYNEKGASSRNGKEVQK